MLIAAVMLAALGAGVWYSNRRQDASAADRPKDAPPSILKVPEDQISELRFRKGPEVTVVKQVQQAKWAILEPRPLEVDITTLQQVTTALADLASDRIVEEQAADLAPFGLATPSYQLEILKKDGKTVRLLFGDETPSGTAFFVKMEGDARVFSLANYTKATLDKSWKDLRDKRLLTVDGDKLSRVEVAAKGQATELGRINTSEWQILKPRPARADSFQVADFVSKITGATMSAESEPDAEKRFAAAAPVATIQLTGPAGTQKLEVRKIKDDFYARSSQVEGVHKLSKETGEAAARDFESFRNRKLFDFGFSEPTRVEIRRDGAATVREKGPDGWMAAGKKQDTASVANLIDKLRDLSAAAFREGAAPPPAVELAVTSGDGKRTERVTLGQQGGKWIGQRAGEPALYELDAKIVDELLKAHADVKEAPPPPKK
ncbi:MAG: DUF4340 domain-containing protein [Bryobacteraceae bacterium]|nr:DUF4340 domain-containing protein [Bryobacteraceae bacterium]